MRQGGASSEPDPQLFTDGEKLRLEGKCKEAVPYYFRLAMAGSGQELSQYYLAECLIADSAHRLSSTGFIDGLVWMRRSAEAGLPEAEGALSLLYLEGPGGLIDPVEAATWFALYERNPRRHKVGFAALPDATIERIRRELGPEALAAGRKRAEGRREVSWSRPDKSLPDRTLGGGPGGGRGGFPGAGGPPGGSGPRIP